MGSGSCSPSRGTGGCCRGPTARGERNARRRRPKVRGNGRYDDGRLDGDEVYANAAQRRAHPGVDDDSLIQDTIESIEETCAVGGPFNGHRSFCVFQERSSYPANGARSAPPTEGQPFSSALSMEQTISRMGLRGAPRRRSRCTGPRRQHGPLSSTRSRTSTMLLALCPALWYCGPALQSTDTHPLSNRQRGRHRDTVQRGCLIRHAQISAS